MIQEIIRACLLVATLIASTITDITTKKIPNYITFPFMGISFVFALVTDIAHIYEPLIAVGILFLLGFIGVMGMGDLKLMMGVTLLCGWRISVLGLFVGAVSFILWHFAISPRKVMAETNDALKSVLNGNYRDVNEKGERKVFAPFLAIGIVACYLLITVFAVWEVF